MKKCLLIIISLLCVNYIYSQVLYAENFDSFNWGYLGTDPTGKIPGQGGWCTYSEYTKSNSFFTIVNEPGRGKVLDITSGSNSTNEYFLVCKQGLNTLLANRLPGNDVFMFEVDYFTGTKQYNGVSSMELISPMQNYWFNSSPDTVYFPFFHISKITGHVADAYTYMPFNTWVTVIVYIDYPNKKSYTFFPNYNIVSVRDFPSKTSPNDYLQDYPISNFILRVSLSNLNQITYTRNKYDNIKLTAINAVPPNVIALSVNEQLATKFNLYPNPATNVVNISNAENMQVNQITVYNLAGKQISKQDYNNQAEIQLNVEHLASGTYLFYLQTAQGTAVKKLVKK
ncbi:T9SS type A sorting domain-containing protein [Myroides sp. JBRI-B21084]|uniref:T9SS type A sorting domain-containing protein n=1 Tax=Myroides sp. JBRI-B21084 TaxID=3119977 RepID=UPI0026E385BA|nr:T9SS type A sorting domain-containing protein [Paenimyroides cloacae]WKW45953.1 T9SS type A sorting domain-containing protein [Paenimyroides cloacae]